ncbi:MAG: amino acid adenylation domain-containing protein [Lachnospiraceae bacterium]|nr:amino acid adenylation domain-containing protein [Lachnospiraceae bacterium]
MVAAYICAVKGLLAEEEIKNISLCDEDEIGHLDSFNDTETDYIKAPVVEQFREMAKAYPDHKAVVCGDDVLTYAELDDLSERIGACLISKGMGAENVAGILIPRGVHMATAALGVQKAGSAYQPLDASYPKERLQFMLEDSGAKILITTKNMIALVPDYQGEVLYLEDLPKLPTAENSGIIPDMHDLFCLLYTSGTTGLPKGVQIEQGNIATFCGWYRKFYGINSSSRVAAYASFGFDANMMDLYGALTNGASLYIITEDMRLDFVALNKYFCDNEITDAFMTTQIGRAFALETQCPSLKSLSLGGEKLVPLAVSDKAFRIVNGYGPTECTIFTTAFDVDKYYERVPIGKVLDNFKAYVLDKDGNRQPAGACGELIVAGPQVSRGYLNRPENTAKSFIENPFCQEDGYKTAYRTGDVVRFLPDGTLDIVGRNDDQVKVRGFRIELTEVEEVIRRFEGVKDATVKAFDDPNGGKAIAAYVVVDGTLDVNALKAYIAAEKPPYMVPAAIMQLEAIPYNTNQKVNKRALPEPDFKADKERAAVSAPLNKLEKEISGIVEEVLKTEVQDITEPLSMLGLTSISAIKLALLIYKRFGVQLEARSFVNSGSLQTIENAILDQWMMSGVRESGASSANEIGTEKVGTEKTGTAEASSEGSELVCPLTFEQQGVYTECLANPEATLYNMPFALKLPAAVGADNLKEALLKVIDAHPSLKSHFTSDADHNVVMAYVPDYKPEIPIRDMSEAELGQYKKNFVRPFDLHEVPARYEIVKADNLYLLFDIHHLLADGASIDLFEEELCLVLDGKEPEKEDLSYFAYSKEETIRPEDEAFFAEQMGDVEEASKLLPDIFENGLSSTEGEVAVAVDLETIEAIAAKVNATPASVGLAAVQVTVARFLAEDITAIATISNGRSNLRIANTIGMFVNTLALTSQIDWQVSIDDYIKATAKNFGEVIDHEHYPFARLAGNYDFYPAVSYAWQVGTLTGHATQYGELFLEPLSLSMAKIPVSVFFEDDEKGGKVRVVYDESLYSHQMMTGFAESIANVIREMICKKTLSEISLTDEKAWQMLDGYNRPFDLDYDKNDTAVSRFRYQAKAHPDKIAAVYKDKAFTFKELDDLTDKLSAIIYDRISKQTGRDKLSECVVAIISGRNEKTFIMPLSVLKAGCAYQPLDPSYPKERLNFMVSDAGAVLLLAEDELGGLVDEYTGQRLTFSELYGLLEACPDIKPVDIKIEPKDLFVMLYTSGTAGQPKGVQIEHGNVVAFAHGTALEGFYTGDDVTAAYASFGFDVNMADVFATLLNGGTVNLVPEDIRMNLGELAGYFDANGITEILMTTQVGVQFLQNYPTLKTLKHITLGGEKLPAVHPEELSYTIINGYGPTENCCGVSLFPVKEWEANIPLGKPMKTIHGYVLDKTGHRLPAGAAGEYCLSGPQVSRGYLNRPEKTKEAYEDCPFDEFRLYHTGDIVRYRQNGDVEFVGRKDNQVKIRGFRIETKEVETVIRDFPGVRDTTVQPYDYESGGKYLAAFVVYDGELSAEELADFIKSRKPAYMVPAVIMQLEAIPLTVNQKVDRKALPKPEAKKKGYVEPKTKAEQDFCQIFGEVLDLEKVSAEDNFFDIGGSSIAAMKVVTEAENLGYHIVYQNLFDHPVPTELAAMFSGEGETDPAGEASDGAACDGSYYGPHTVEIDRDGYDYTRINALLRQNTLDVIKNGEAQDVGDVLLFGATGYLGIHMLRELLTSGTGKITCLVRPGKDMSAKERLEDYYQKYFYTDAKAAFEGRVEVYACSEIDKAALGQITENGLTVINCSANVKHFSRTNDIEKANYDAVLDMIDWCLAHDSRLVHISTESVMGNAVGQVPPASFSFTENVLYVGQDYESNRYTRSKFLAERAIYEAILDRGLNGRVIRVGNLAPRRDGQFQLNYATNSFMNCLKSYRKLGVIPYDPSEKLGILPYLTMDGLVEFSPIEDVAHAVYLLAKMPKACVCFAASNNRLVRYGDIVMALADDDNPIGVVSSEAFAARIKEAQKDPELMKYASELVMYNPGSSNIRLLGPDSIDNSLTTQALYSMGFRWLTTGDDYVTCFAEKLKKLGFFEP